MTVSLPALAPSRHADRESHDPAVVRAILAEAMIVHLGVVRDGWPVVLPFHFGLADLGDGNGEQMIIHGSTGGRVFLDAAASEQGVRVSACVTHNDGLVLGRSTYNTGAHYRSVVLYGYARRVPDEYRLIALDALTEHIIPGRVGEVRPATRKELAQTALLAIPLDHASAKVADTSTGEQPGDGEDRTVWAGIVPLGVTAGTPVAAPENLSPEEIPASVRGLMARLNRD